MLYSMRPMRSHSFVSTHTHTHVLWNLEAHALEFRTWRRFSRTFSSSSSINCTLNASAFFKLSMPDTINTRAHFKCVLDAKTYSLTPVKRGTFQYVQTSNYTSDVSSRSNCAPPTIIAAQIRQPDHERARAHTLRICLCCHFNITHRANKHGSKCRTDIGRVCAYVPAQILVRGIAQSLGVSDSDVADKLCHEFPFFVLFAVLY